MFAQLADHPVSPAEEDLERLRSMRTAMAVHALHNEFIDMQRCISLGDRALVAIAAHIEVRSVLSDAPELRAHGLDDVLIGSYARRVSNWPGKDVDVFGRLTAETVHSIQPEAAYEMFGRALAPFQADGRLQAQPRSFKIEFSQETTPGKGFIRAAAREYAWEPTRVERVLANLGQVAFEFSVDVVPAAIWEDHYGIPETGRYSNTGEPYRTGHWRRTDPVQLTEATQLRNRDPRVAGVGAFVRTVKAVKQIKAHHLPDTKPSSLYYEFILHEGFKHGAIDGDSWADVTASALSYIAARVATAGAVPVCDPVLHESYRPTPSPEELMTVGVAFEELALRARSARTGSAKRWACQIRRSRCWLASRREATRC